MSTGCGRHFCKWCEEEMIHRDHRKFYESASALGQIIWREGPDRLSVTDLDVVSRKGLPNGLQLLRGIEQKQPGHKFEDAQEQTLRLLDSVIVHAGLCPAAVELHVDPRSGIYVIRGEVAAAADWPRQTMFCGTQQIVKLATGETWKIRAHEPLFRFLDPEDTSRRDPRRRDRKLPDEALPDATRICAGHLQAAQARTENTDGLTKTPLQASTNPAAT